MNARRLAILADVVSVLGLLRLVWTQSMFAIGPISLALQVAAGLFMLWARLTYGLRRIRATTDTTAGVLVTHGPYAIVRHPIYASVLWFAWTGIAVHFSIVNLLLGLVVSAGLLTRIFIEERFLRERHRAYADYAKRVKRLVPFVF